MILLRRLVALASFFDRADRVSTCSVPWSRRFEQAVRSSSSRRDS